MTREVLTALERESAFQTSARFDLLAETHVGLVDLGAADVEAQLERAIAKAEGVIAVTGRIGSGKSSLIAAVTSALNEGYVPLRVSVVGIEAGEPAAFARHAMIEIRDLPDTRLTEHERRALERDTALARTAEKRRELRAGFEIAAGEVLKPKVAADIKKIAGETLSWPRSRRDHRRAPAGARRVLAAWPLPRVDRRRRIRETFTAELHLPAPPDPRAALITILQRRMDGVDVSARATDVFESAGLDLLRDDYLASVHDGRAGDVRHALVVARTAVELAVEDDLAEAVTVGHMQEALAHNPPGPSSAAA